MSLKDRFSEELRYLHELGNDFAKDNPQLARLLGKAGSDPDVERLMEAFAFLTAKLRLKLEDDLPELTHPMLQILWPNYLRPLPSATIIQFSPRKQSLSQSQHIPKGARLFSKPVDAVPCEFRTCTGVSLHPFEISAVSATQTLDSSVVRIGLQTLVERPLNTLGCARLDFHLSGDNRTALTLYLWISQYLKHVSVIMDGEVRRLPANSIAFPGFSPEEALLPYPQNVFDGYRILQEYFVFPKRFHFFSITGLEKLWPAQACQQVGIEFHFTRQLPEPLRVGTEDFSLFCTPAVNLFKHSAEPIDLASEAAQVELKPRSEEQSAYEIFSVDEVISTRTTTDGSTGEHLRTFRPFESFAHEIEHVQGRTALYYRYQLEESLRGDGVTHRIAFVRADANSYIGELETASIDLTCTNRDLPLALGVDDINVLTEVTPPLATYTNICAPTRPYRPVLDGQLQWALISNMSLNYLSLLSVEPLKAVIRTYDFAALHDIQQARTTGKRLDGIRELHTQPMDWLIKGQPIRGLHTQLKLDQAAFLCEGDLYLFGCVLAHFFALYASINSFHQLEVINTTNNEHYTWPIQTGKQPLI
ncbi:MULTISPECIES: type VI secretion system baseplate subunit TssF [Pseudomonas]|uniref:type VI secretion system baseplate subunit TssF n=1 Tax=Pseudomonas TaxID=286 RepID=UPI0016892B86|nr:MULTISPECIES: type VI secretion system baseplate subunit TssF [Pseudomonas]QNV68454.1 type VI secretion system baseplate subunit TssF [Pseudomonas sp. CFA]MCX2815042.1 type VI secretion system baseplate subunit TssF [Pseudomonas sp. DCB_E]MCX9143865.1 type VI secretion system baseplate subunit TssF [Pseudomonas sp. DCB_Q]MDD2005738.1 type VI secretion system baseplate subunit TssF [Pseudomonas putida]MDH0705814.1 type VI secretion system baseplate subunit TssF [Pseudomonas sp. GD03862]